eukprot:1148670-Pelagomonas_calceolata.AAC.4
MYGSFFMDLWPPAWSIDGDDAPLPMPATLSMPAYTHHKQTKQGNMSKLVSATCQFEIPCLGGQSQLFYGKIAGGIMCTLLCMGMHKSQQQQVLLQMKNPIHP